ncbi:MAG: hypothetical protein QM820_63370 [Minicystis sp.]
MLPLALLCAACSGSLPRPPSGPVPKDAFTDEVPYPPPAARVEVITKRTNERAVWVDGQWEWDGETWKWLSGRWMLPPPGAYFTPWTAVRRPDGRLFFARATWRSRDGKPLDFGFGHDVCPPGTAAPQGSQVAGQ